MKLGDSYIKHRSQSISSLFGDVRMVKYDKVFHIVQNYGFVQETKAPFFCLSL